MEEKTKTKLTRGVLLFSAIIVGVVSVYTTILLFQTSKIDVTFSPPIKNQSNETNNTNSEVSFDIDGEFPDEFGIKKQYKNEEIPPHDQYASEETTKPGPIDLLITLEDNDPESNLTLLLMIILEIATIYIIYRQLDIKLKLPS